VPVDVVMEQGRKRTFANAIDWPGWARSSSANGDALVVLDEYRERYADVLSRASLTVPKGALRIIEVVDGDATTDFGAPGATADADHRALRAPERARLAAILTACWSRFDDVASQRLTLSTGPRGGGRDLSKMRLHVADAEVAYARGLGLKVAATNGDVVAIAALRDRLLGVLAGDVVPDREPKWPLRYAVRRIAWHVTDHLFEIEDRAT
jgi:hypothetical protein